MTSKAHVKEIELNLREKTEEGRSVLDDGAGGERRRGSRGQQPKWVGGVPSRRWEAASSARVHGGDASGEPGWDRCTGGSGDALRELA